MKNTMRKLLCSLLIILMALPAISLSVTAEEPWVDYSEADDGDLLLTLDFNADYWNNKFEDSNNEDANVTVSEDGSSVNIALIDATNDRAMWGGLLDEYKYPLKEAVNGQYKYNKYTIMFDADFGHNYVGFGVKVDGNHVLVVNGYGYCYWYNWNTKVVDKETGYAQWNWNIDGAKTDKQTFAVEVDPEKKTMSLYVKDYDGDGAFNHVRTMTVSNAEFGEDLTCQLYATRTTNGAPTAAYNVDVSNVQLYKGLVAGEIEAFKGAAARIDDPSGLCFGAQFRKAAVDSLRATYGADNVKLGMIIAPTDYIVNSGVGFEMSALDALADGSDEAAYVKIEASTVYDDGTHYSVNCALESIQSDDYGRAFSARAYIEVNGEVYKYSDFDLKNHSRSVAEVVMCAIGDVKNAKDDEYKYSVTVNGSTKYSPYSEDERNTLNDIFAEYGESDKVASISVMTYNIEMYKDDGWGGRNISAATKTITDYAPDVVGVQEDDDYWRNSGEYSALTSAGYERVAFAGNGSENLDIFYKSDKFELVTSGQKFFKRLAEGDYSDVDPKGADLSIDTSGDKEKVGGSIWNPIKRDKGRMFSYVVVRDKQTGTEFLVVNTHLHYGDGTGSAEKYVDDNLVRDYQARLLRAWLDDMAEEYPNQIVMGDMNATPTTSTIAEFSMNNGMSFARDTALFKGDTDGTLASTSTYLSRQQYVFDHIIYRNVLASEYTVVDNKTDEVEGEMRYPSDHLPVYAKFICNA